MKKDVFVSLLLPISPGHLVMIMQYLEGIGRNIKYVSVIFSRLDDIPLYSKIQRFFDFVWSRIQ